MKEVAILIVLSPLMAGCVSNDKIAVAPEQLQHRRSMLESVNGKPVINDENPSEISFGEKVMVSDSMCNCFSDEGKLPDDELTAEGLAMTHMTCANLQLNELDNTISEMLKEGVQVDLAANQLTLVTAEQTLTYKPADLMSQQLPQLPAASDCSLQRLSLGDAHIPIAAPSS